MCRSSESKQEQRRIFKPPNVVIYADSPNAVNNIKTVLKKALDPNRYIILNCFILHDMWSN